jgi:hypothetical protein
MHAKTRPPRRLDGGRFVVRGCVIRWPEGGSVMKHPTLANILTQALKRQQAHGKPW